MPNATVLRPPAGIVHEPSGADIWNAIVQAAIASFRVRAFHAVTIEVVATASGYSAQTVRGRFPTLDHLVVATVQVWNAERMAGAVPFTESDGAVGFLSALMRADVEDPALVRLLTAVVNIAATPDHPMADGLQGQWIRFSTWVVRALTRDVALGREPKGLDPARGAEQLIAIYEGLQLQSMMRPGMDLLSAWEHAVVLVRSGWSSGFTVWEV